MSEEREVPPILTPLQVAKACSSKDRTVTKKTARGWLRRAGALEKHGGVFVAHESVVREKLPDVYQRVYAYFVFGGAAH